jgi:aspartate--ammonia ligase
MGFQHTSSRVPAVATLDLWETEAAIKHIKDDFETGLAEALNLRRVTAPLVVPAGSGVNDDLNGVEVPVRFPVRGLGGQPVEVVQSLAKWKRLTLARLRVPPGQGIYTDMNAIRPDESLDPLHSVYVDQWDWERTIEGRDRTLEFLETIVSRIYGVIRRTEIRVGDRYPELDVWLPETMTFVHAEELERQYPHLTPAERERHVAEAHGAVFIIGIGADLPGSGVPHDGRAPDYDDWITPNGHGLGLNGDLVVWYPPLRCALELSSMGIRVTPDSLLHQLALRGCSDRRDLFFHRTLLEGALPLSIGGGIGQSRLCMFLLRKRHIGEVQAGVWPDAMVVTCRADGIELL